MHTICSFGEWTPDRLAFEVWSKGLRVAVCDHYTVDGVVAAKNVLKKYNEDIHFNRGCEKISGIEFSVRLNPELNCKN